MLANAEVRRSGEEDVEFFVSSPGNLFPGFMTESKIIDYKGEPMNKFPGLEQISARAKAGFYYATSISSAICKLAADSEVADFIAALRCSSQNASNVAWAV